MFVEQGQVVMTKGVRCYKQFNRMTSLTNWLFNHGMDRPTGPSAPVQKHSEQATTGGGREVSEEASFQNFNFLDFLDGATSDKYNVPRAQAWWPWIPLLAASVNPEETPLFREECTKKETHKAEGREGEGWRRGVMGARGGALVGLGNPIL